MADETLVYAAPRDVSVRTARKQWANIVQAAAGGQVTFICPYQGQPGHRGGRVPVVAVVPLPDLFTISDTAVWGVYEARQRFADAVDVVTAGTTIILTQNSGPVALLVNAAAGETIVAARVQSAA